MKAEKAVQVDYSARLKPPYKWSVNIIGDRGTKMIVKRGEGAWVNAIYAAQELEKILDLKTNSIKAKKH